MTVEIAPAGIKCNLQCTYCYQNPMRDAGGFAELYDLDAIKEAVSGHGEITLFGGEALLAPLPQLEELLAIGYERAGHTGIQTNGTLINDDHMDLFRRYRTGVGISIDGPAELNDVRWAGSLEAPREATARIEENIARLCAAGIGVSIIVTLHRLNTGAALPRLREWIRGLFEVGVNSMRLHILEVDSPLVRRKYVLSDHEYLEAFLDLLQLERELGKTMFDVSTDMRRMLIGEDNNVTCVWAGCDPYNTGAVYGVGPDGDLHNCGRTNKDGVNWQKADSSGWERYLALYHTPQEHGGCNGCRFFLMCRGNCPGTAIDGDWRNRSEFCKVWKGLYTYIELDLLTEGIQPLSLSPQRPELERDFLAQLEGGCHGSVSTLLGGDGGHGDSHGDHLDGGVLQ